MLSLNTSLESARENMIKLVLFILRYVPQTVKKFIQELRQFIETLSILSSSNI